MLDKDIAATITAAVDAGFEAQIRFTQDMVRCPSVRGQEHTVQDLMADAMARRGLSYAELRAVNPSLIMLSTSMNGQTGPRRTFAGGVHFASHISGNVSEYTRSVLPAITRTRSSVGTAWPAEVLRTLRSSRWR